MGCETGLSGVTISVRCACRLAELSAHLAMRRKMWPYQRMRSAEKPNNNSLKEECRNGGIKQNAKSHQRAGEPGAAQTSFKKSKRLSRTPLKTFPLRQGRDDEGPILVLSGSQNQKTNLPLSLDSTSQCCRARQRHDLQPVRGRT